MDLRNAANKYGLFFDHLRVGSSLAPNYTVTNHNPVFVETRKYAVRKSRIAYSQVDLRNIEAFTITGNVQTLQVGDILQLNTSLETNSLFPALTVYQKTDNFRVLGFKSDRIGKIMNGSKLVYDNIRFSFLPNSDYPGRPMDREMEDSLSLASIEIITFKKALYTSTQNAEGLYLHVKDMLVNGVVQDVRWVIQSVVEDGYCQILTLKRDG